MPWTPAEVFNNLTSPESDALIEELKHWNVTVMDDGNAKLTIIQES
jgi:hypothetical protein